MNQNTEKQVSNKQQQEIKMKNQEMRIININGIQPKKYTRNYIRTAKYNWFTFLPLSIFYQFNNYFNCFFLFTAVLTSISIISPLDPATAIGPFLFVLCISLIREAYEDIKKTNYDKMANNSMAHLYSIDEKKFIEMKWSDLHVGKIIKVKKNEMIPSDILVIKSSEENGLCYLETTNLDGESALKPRQAIVIYHQKIQQEECLANIVDLVEVDLPNNHIYKVEGSIYFKKGEKNKEFFSIENVLLRGGRLKNVEYVYGLVIYTGRDTKIMQNIKEGLPKQSTIEIKLNTIILYILLVVIFLCVICTVFGAFFRADLLPDYVNNRRKGEYIYYYDPSSSSDSGNDILEIIRIFAGLFIIFNTLIPISLMIASEIIKTFQVQLIEMDREMKQDPDDKLKILSMKLHEDLGMVRYIFSDKTGTLTKNEMSFRACSIFAKSFGETDEEADKNNHDENRNVNNNNNNTNINLNVFNSNQKFASFGKINTNVNNNTEKQNVKKSIFSHTFNKDLLRNSILEGGIMNIKDIKESPIQTLGEACKEFFFNISLNHNVLVELEEKEEAALGAIEEATNRQKGELGKSKNFESGKNLDLNSTPINKISNNNNIINEENSNLNNLMNADLNNNNNNKNNINYQGSNPDEVVLVTAAAEIGIKFVNKDKDSLNVSYFDQLKKFKILQKFEFSSERKRSSIIVEDEEGKIKIYVKGSDEKILHPSNINEFSKKFLLKESKEHLDSFARIGLRTLCFAYKNIEKDAYKKWEQILNNKKQECIIDKTKNSELETVISEMEEDLILLGVTALEDKLQDNVRNDLQEYMEAGISVWMITGDKLDTAESIGHSCKLFNDDTEVFKIKSSEKNETKKCLEDIKKKFDLMKGDCEDLNVLGKQIQENNAESVTKSGSRNGKVKKSNTKIIKNNKETIINNINNNNNFESPNVISNLNDKTKNTDIPFKLGLNQIVYTNENFKELNNKNSDLDNLKIENDVNFLVQNTDMGPCSQYDLNKFLTNNQGLSLNGSPEFNRKDRLKNNRNNNDNCNYDANNNVENRIFDVIKFNDPNKAVTSNDNNVFGISNGENANNVNTIREFNNHNIHYGGNLDKNSISDRTKKDERNEKFNQFKQFNQAEKIGILDQRLSNPNSSNNIQNEINIHLPVDAGRDLGSSVKIFNNEKNSIPFSFKDLNAVNSISTKKEKDNNTDKIKGNNDFNYKGDNYDPSNTNFGDNFDNVVQNLNIQLDAKDGFIVVYDEFENGISENRVIKALKNNNAGNLINKNPFVNSIEKANNKQDTIEKREKQLNNFELNANSKKEITEKDLIFENFGKGELNKKLNSNVNLFQVFNKLSLNDDLHTDKDLERNLDLISNSQTPSLNKSITQKSNKKNGNKTFNSNLSSDEGDEFYDAKRLDCDKSLKNLGNSNNKRLSNFKDRKNLKNLAANVNKIKRASSFKINSRRRSLTPNISIIDRNNLIDTLGQKLVEKINIDSYQNNNNKNNNIYELGKTPMPNETDKENLDISDRSIIEYLMNNHILDDSQGHFYNPTFLGYYINKQNLNDTNNKILQDSNNNNHNNENNQNEKTPNSKSISRNLIKGKISISNLKSLIRERNISNSINLKEKVNSVSQLNNKMADGIIDVSHNGAKNSLKDNSLDVSNNNEIRYDQNNNDLSGNENGVSNKNNLSNSKKIEFGIDGDEMSFKKKHLRMNQGEDSKSREKIYKNSIRKKVKNEGVAELGSNNNKNNSNDDYNKGQQTYKRDKTNYADPAMFLSTKPQKHKTLNLEAFNSKGLQNNEYIPNETRNSKTSRNIKKQKNADVGNEENENENMEQNNNFIKQSDEKRFLSNEATKNKNKKTKSEKVLPNNNTKNQNLNHNTALNLMRDPTKDLLKSSLEKGQKINLNQIMEYLENLILENEKNRKKTLMNLIDFKKTGGTEDPNENVQFKVMNLGVLIEGDSISHCLDDDMKDLFWNIVKNSKSVVCCRCSPKQKAEVVGFVKKKSNEVTLAIGDGGNDIPMIKIANIGVGIFGKEGYQAAFNADYAVSQFKYLKRLIFVHGRNSLLRNSYFIYFFFFKNVLFTLSQLWFCFFSGFSGQNFYDSWYYLGFNSFLSSFPVAARTIVEEDIDLNWVYTNQKEKKINLIPDIYQEYRDSVPFHILKFFFVFITALIYSMIVYFIPFYIFQYNFQDDSGRPFTLYDHSLSSYLAVLIVHFFFLFEDTYFYNWFIFFIYFLQIGVLILFIFVHESLNSGEISGVTHDILWNFNFWAVTMLTCAITCLLFLIVRRFDFLFSDTIINSIMQNKFESNFTQKLYKKKLEEIRKFHRSVAKFKKIFKMKNEDFDNLSDKRFKDIVDAYKRNHQVDKKSNVNNINKESADNKKQEHQLPILKRAKSQCSDDLNMKDKRTNIYEKITNDGKDYKHKKQGGTQRKIQFKNDIVNENNNYNNRETDDDAYERNKDDVKKYQTFNKNNIHLFDFNSHPSKFFNQD